MLYGAADGIGMGIGIVAAIIVGPRATLKLSIKWKKKIIIDKLI